MSSVKASQPSNPLFFFLTQTRVMAHLWTLMSAGLLVLAVAEYLSNPEENEVLKHAEGELTKRQARE